jgi:hypothetical protein
MNVKWVPSQNFTQGRTQKIKKIVIHWIVGDLAAADTVFTVTRYETSAHYAIENNTVHQYVKESDTAWHAMQANPFSIGIEHSAAPGRLASDSTYRTSITLCAAICVRYDLNPDTDIEPHNKYVNTQCPGTMDLERIKKGVKELLKGGEMRPYNNGDAVNISNDLGITQVEMKGKKDWNDAYYAAVAPRIRQLKQQVKELAAAKPGEADKVLAEIKKLLGVK